MAADTVAGYIQGLLDAVQFKRASYAVDRDARTAAMNRFLSQTVEVKDPLERLAA